MTFLELTLRFCPEAVPLAKQLTRASSWKLREMIQDDPRPIKAYLAAMAGRVAETTYHFTVGGTLFVGREIVSIDFASGEFEYSYAANRWYRVTTSGADACASKLISYADFIIRHCNRLVESDRNSYLFLAGRDIRGLIAMYLAAPALHMKSIA